MKRNGWWVVGIVLFAPAGAWAQQPEDAADEAAVTVEDVVTNEEAGHAWFGTQLGFWFDDFSLGRLDRRFDDPEVSALAGRELTPNGMDRTVAWGVVLVTDMQPTPWLRLPQVRLYVGGSSLDAGWHGVEGAPESVEVRPTGLIVLRAELAGGLQYRFGPVIPFALARIGYAGWFLDVETRDDRLGPLGEETICDGGFEGGFELGAALAVNDNVQLSVAWRRTLLGPANDGVMVAVSVGQHPIQ